MPLFDMQLSRTVVKDGKSLLKTVYNVIEESLEIPHPVTGYDGNQCLNILQHRDKWLPAFSGHPLHVQIQEKWQCLNGILHIAAVPDAQAMLPQLKELVAKYSSLLVTYFAAGAIRPTKVDGRSHDPLPRPAVGSDLERVYMEFAAQDADAYSAALLKFPLLEYTWKLYDHFTMCHVAAQIEDVGNLLAGSSWFIESGNAAWKATMRHHTSGGGGRDGDQIWQAFKRMWAITHPLIQCWNREFREERYKHKCSLCGQPKEGHRCLLRGNNDE